MSNSERRVSRSGSVPNLATLNTTNQLSLANNTSPIYKSHTTRNRCARNSSLVQRSTREIGTNPYLHPNKLNRHALSVDETGQHFHKLKEFQNGSLMDGAIGGCGTESRSRTKRSDTARRHVLSRQKPIEKDEPNANPKNNQR